MKKRKKVREKGKISLRKTFQEFKNGDKVALIQDLGVKKSFPRRFHGLTGIIESKRGYAYVVKFLNGRKHKKLTLKPIHLKKLKY